jgi:AraC family transcriptional regulator
LSALDEYRGRFRRVLEHVDAHLDGELRVEELGRVAAFSKYHFHRQFAALFGFGVHEYVKGVRLVRAGYRLAFRDDERILDIALASGYESHEAFSRAFKKLIGQTPSEFREKPRWEAWHAFQDPLNKLRSDYMNAENTRKREDVKVVDFPATRIAVLEHHGDPKRLNDTIRRFIEWRKQNDLTPRTSRTFNLLYGDPATTPPDTFRLDLCASSPRAIGTNDAGIVERSIPAGRYAVLRHRGSDANLGESFQYLYARWLPGSGEELRDFPLFLERLTFFPDVPEHEALVDIFLPLR